MIKIFIMENQAIITVILAMPGLLRQIPAEFLGILLIYQVAPAS